MPRKPTQLGYAEVGSWSRRGTKYTLYQNALMLAPVVCTEPAKGPVMFDLYYQVNKTLHPHAVEQYPESAIHDTLLANGDIIRDNHYASEKPPWEDPQTANIIYRMSKDKMVLPAWPVPAVLCVYPVEVLELIGKSAGWPGMEPLAKPKMSDKIIGKQNYSLEQIMQMSGQEYRYEEGLLVTGKDLEQRYWMQAANGRALTYLTTDIEEAREKLSRENDLMNAALALGADEFERKTGHFHTFGSVLCTIPVGRDKVPCGVGYYSNGNIYVLDLSQQHTFPTIKRGTLKEVIVETQPLETGLDLI